MSHFLQDILNYGRNVNNIYMSPFESVQLLPNRSELQLIYHELTLEEQQFLSEFDMLLFKNASTMDRHIQKAYDFNLSTEPFDEWWWHLDKVLNGRIKNDITSIVKGRVM